MTETEKFLMDSRDIYIDDEITSRLATNVILQIAANLKHFDDNCTPQKDRIITVHINDSPGGSVSAGLAIFDAMKCCDAKIKVICSGMVASMAVVIVLAGDKGMRCAYPHTEFLMHQPLGGATGQASDILIQAKHIEKVRSGLYNIISEFTGQSYFKIAEDADRDFILTANEAVSYGIIDEIIKIKGDGT